MLIETLGAQPLSEFCSKCRNTHHQASCANYHSSINTPDIACKIPRKEPKQQLGCEVLHSRELWINLPLGEHALKPRVHGSFCS